MADSSFALSFRDDRQQLPGLRALLKDPSEEAQSSAMSQLMFFGNKLELWEAEQLEAFVGQGPEDLWLRILLLGCYQIKRQSESARGSLRAHISWIIQNVPESWIAGTLGSFCLEELKDASEFCDQAKKLWIGVITANPETALLLGRAAQCFMHADAVWSGELLRQAKAIDPHNPRWPRQLAFLYDLEMISRHDESRRDWAAMALAEWQYVGSLLTDEQQQTELLDDLAKAAFEAGDLEKADGYARELLARKWLTPHPGDAIHIGNVVLGRISLMTGDTEKAKRHLIESARTDGSPVLCSFGPRMVLAKELLDRGETDIVLRYLKLCSAFWKSGRNDLAQWVEQVEQGLIPDFPRWQY